jgi:hypothetical protein
MKQTLTLTPSSDALGLDPWPSGAPLVITGTVASYPAMDSWTMQLWKRPHDAQVVDAEPLASAVGSVATGTLTIAFSPSQMSYDNLGLNNVVGANPFYLVLGGENTSGQQEFIRYGTVEIIPIPFSSSAPTTPAAITVTDDIATFSFNGSTYRVPVEEVASPDGAVEGEIVVVDDIAILTVDGVSYTFPVEETA